LAVSAANSNCKSTTPLSRNLSLNEAYDPGSDSWQRLLPIPTARSGTAAVVLEGRIFVVGGEATTGTFHQVEAYDPKSDRWTSSARMPTPRHGLGAAVYAGRMHVISGGPTPGGSYSAVNKIFHAVAHDHEWLSPIPSAALCGLFAIIIALR
jgi:N-acetylneuraminic acid mutarotase